MRVPLHALQLFAFVSPAAVRINLSRTCTQIRAVPDQAGNDAARKALEQAAKIRQEVADLEKEISKGLCLGTVLSLPLYFEVLCMQQEGTYADEHFFK